MINEADKQYTIIKIKVAEANQVFTVKSGYVYWWGEGARIDSPKPTDQSHKYTEVGEYLVYIKGVNRTYTIANTTSGSKTYSTFIINDTNSKKMIIEVLNFGNTIQSLYDAFSNCVNLVKIPTYTPSSIVDLSFAFTNCSSLKEPIQYVNDSVLHMVQTYNGCSLIKKAYKYPKNLIDIYGCYWGCRLLKNAPDFPENIENGAYVYASCESIVLPPKINNNCKKLNSVLEFCKSLIEMPDIPNGVTDVVNAFKVTAITETKILPEGIKSLQYTFSNCEKLIKIKNVPSTVNNMDSTFARCTSLEKIDLKYSDFPNANSFNSTFEGCTKLKNSIQGKPTRLSFAKRMYYNCISLEEISDVHLVMTGGLISTNEGNMYYNCKKIKTMNGEPYSIFDLPDYTGGLINTLALKINIPSDNYAVTITNGNIYQWGTGQGSVSGKTKMYPKGEYIMILTLNSDNFSSIDRKEVITEIIHIPSNFNMPSAFTGCKNLKKCCSLEKVKATSLLDSFRECESLEYAPKLRDSVENLNQAFYESGIKYITNIPKSLKTADFAFSKCKNLKSVDFTFDSNVESLSSFLQDDINLTKLRLDLSLISNNEVILSFLIKGCKSLKSENLEIIFPQDISFNLKQIFQSIDNGEILYKLPSIKPENFGASLGMYGNGEEMFESYKSMYIPMLLAGTISEDQGNDMLENLKNMEQMEVSKSRVKKCYNIWKYFPEAETKEWILNDSFPVKNSQFTFTGNREINTFIDYKTGEETFGSYGLIPEIWGGAYSDSKNVIAVRVPAGTTINIIKDANSYIDGGKYCVFPTTKNSITYEEEGKYFISSEDDFDIADDSCKYVVEICHLNNDSTICKKGLSRFINLVYCNNILSNDDGDYSDYFANCHALINSPTIPSNAIKCDRMFASTNIKNAPNIPIGVISCQGMFDECKNLVSDTVIPTTVKNCKFAFRHCFALKNTVQTFSGYSIDLESENCYLGTKVENVPDNWK